MTHDDLRQRLRASDPARDRDLSPADRIRMRAAVTSARPRVRSRAPILVMTVATAIVLMVVVLSIPHSERVAKAPVSHPALPRPVATVRPPEPVVARPAPSKPARLHARSAVLRSRGGVTRIVFTGPEGTRILWFVGTPDAKELGS